MRRHVVGCLVAAVCAVPLVGPAARGQGFYLPAAGSVHQSMGGASTALALDANGGGYWNPAAIAGLPESEVAIDSAFVIPRISASSTTALRAGTTRSNNGLVVLPATGIVLRFADSPRLTMGMATAVAGGGAVNFPGDPTNPIFAPKFPAAPAPGGITLGPSYANFTAMQVMSSVAFQATDRLAVGAGPVVSILMAGFDPAFFAAPDDANGDGVATFPNATHSRPFYGAGFKVGASYHLTQHLDVGFGYGSPQWCETMRFHSRDEVGNPRELTLPVRLPAYYSWGLAYKGIEKLLLALDLRYIDYKNSTPFGPPVAVGGLAWNDVFAVAMGAQYEVSQRVSARVGYSYNTPPIPAEASLFNIQGPSIIQHVVSVGLTARVAENVFTSLGYAYSAYARVTGSPLQIPGGSSTMEAQLHSIMLTTTVKFGTPYRRRPPATAAPADAGVASTAGPAPGAGYLPPAAGAPRPN